MDNAELIDTLAPALVDLLYRDAGRPQFLALRDHLAALPQGNGLKSRLIASVERAIIVKERFEQHQQRERGLLAVIETAQDLTAITDLDRVLQAIVQRARKLVGCDIGYLSIYDHDQGDFYVRATDGAFSEKFKQIRVGLEVGICGFVARNRAPYSSSDYGTDSRFAHTQLIDTAVLDENIKSILGVPLMAGEQVIGVLFVGDRYVRSYVAWEMSILSTLAAHASVAMGNARLFEQAQAALEQSSRTNLLLARQTANTRAAAEAHEKLTALVAKGGTLRDICDMVANMLEGRVAVHDEGEQQVCWAISPACAMPSDGDDPPAHGYWLADRIHSALDESRILGRSVTAFETAAQACRVSTIIGGRGMLGGLVIYTAAPLSDTAVRIFERSSMVAGVVLLSQERRESASQAELSALLRGLIAAPPDSPAYWSGQAARHGLSLAGPVCMALVETAPGRAGYILKRLRGQLRIVNTLFDEIGGLLVFLCSARAAIELRQALVQYFGKQPHEPMTGVISNPVPTLSGLPRTHQALERCLAFLRALDRKGAIFDERELSLYSVLFKAQGKQDIEQFLACTLLDLYGGGDPRKIELARTLLIYLDGGHHARGAAKKLGIHINTMHQRLDAIDALLGDWRACARALDIHMALRLWALDNSQAFAAGVSQP